MISLLTHPQPYVSSLLGHPDPSHRPQRTARHVIWLSRSAYLLRSALSSVPHDRTPESILHTSMGVCSTECIRPPHESLATVALCIGDSACLTRTCGPEEDLGKSFSSIGASIAATTVSHLGQIWREA